MSYRTAAWLGLLTCWGSNVLLKASSPTLLAFHIFQLKGSCPLDLFTWHGKSGQPRQSKKLLYLFKSFPAGLQVEGSYRPRFELDYNSVIRIPVVPGADPRKLYGDLFSRGVKVCRLQLPVFWAVQGPATAGDAYKLPGSGKLSLPLLSVCSLSCSCPLQAATLHAR